MPNSAFLSKQNETDYSASFQCSKMGEVLVCIALLLLLEMRVRLVSGGESGGGGSLFNPRT